ncbi:MAG: DUF3239 domain-containing protein [Armatimonadota bacterium]
MAENTEFSLVDPATTASNPGELELDRWQWYRHYPLWPTLWAITLGLSLALAWGVHGWFYVLAFVVLIINRVYWAQVRAQFKMGCVNPGVVVALDPPLIAVSTDLSKGIGEYPAVKIIRTRLSRIGAQPPQIGARVPTVALYSPGKDPLRWADFDPRPAQCATTLAAELTRLLQSIPEEEWQQLQTGLTHVPQPYQPGLYLINGGAAQMS